jgi:outer membrane lipoprotein-sorting protein
MFQPPWLTRRTRWAVPTGAVAAVAIVAAGTVITSAASTSPSLPHRTAAQLIADIAATKTWPQTFSGTIATSADLGLPSLPTAGGSGPGESSPTSPSWLLSGSHTYQVWYGGPGRLRVAVPVQLGETDLRADGDSVWLWDSRANTATHYLPAASPASPAPSPASSDPSTATLSATSSAAYSSSLSVSFGKDDPPGTPPTPQQIAQQFLAAVGPTTTVSVADNVTVAGRAAYQLELAPKSSQSLLGRLAVDVDAETHVPLRIQIFARGAASPAFSEGFTALSFAAPDPSNFTFTPPPGAKVRTVHLSAPDLPFAGPQGTGGRGAMPRLPRHLHGVPCRKMGPQIHLVPKHCVVQFPNGQHMAMSQFRKLAHGGRGAPPFGLISPDLLRGCQAGWSAYAPLTGKKNSAACTRRVFGTSWTTVVAFPATGTRGAGAAPDPGLLAVLLRAARPVHGSWGSGRLLTTSLLSVLVTSDGTVLAGAVTPDTLYADAAQLTAQHA